MSKYNAAHSNPYYVWMPQDTLKRLPLEIMVSPSLYIII
jgi:hypothetical protein